MVRPAEARDIDGAVDLLFTHMSSKVPKERWRRLLDYPWRPADADRGQVAVTEDGRVVGFLGLVYADRVIDGATRRFCNICAWYLHRDFRGQGIGQAMQQGAVADPAMTYTIMTATAATGRAFGGHSGFAVLDDTRLLLRRSGGDASAVEVVEDAAAIEPTLSGETLRLFRDHAGYGLRRMLVRGDAGECLVICQVKRKGEDVDYHEVMHASAPGVLARVAPGLADAILPRDRPPEKSVLAIDARFLPAGALPDVERETLRLPRWYRSPDVAPGVIDHLYGEVALLGLKLP